jgi:hypothetical protein
MSNPQLSAKLILDTGQYTQALNKIRNDTNSMTGGLSKSIGDLQKDFKGLTDTVPALGSAMKLVTNPITVASGAFIKIGTDIINAERNADTLQSTIQAGESIYTTFLNNIQDADFSNFIDGLINSADAAKDLYDALDSLGTFKLASSVDSAKLSLEFEKVRLAYKKGEIDKEEYNKRINQLSQEQTKLTNKEIKLTENAARKTIESEAKAAGVKSEMLERVLTGLKSQEDATKRKEQIKKELKITENAINDQLRHQGREELHLKPETSEKYKEEWKTLTFLQNPDDYKKLTDAIALRTQAINLQTDAIRKQNRYLKRDDEQTTNSTTSKSTTSKSSAPRQIEVRSSTLGLDNKQLMGDINLPELSTTFDAPLLDEYADKLQRVIDLLKVFPDVKTDLDYNELWSLNGQALEEYMTELTNDLIEEQNAIDNKKQHEEQMAKTANTASKMSNAFSSASSSLAQFGEQSKAAAAVSKSLMIASAIGQLVAQFASIPKGAEIWSWIAGTVAGTATLITTVASLKGLQTGGIVQGKGTAYSDSVPVALSAGEMVLNAREQRNLFNLLAHPGYTGMGETITTISGQDINIVSDNFYRMNAALV